MARVLARRCEDTICLVELINHFYWRRQQLFENSDIDPGKAILVVGIVIIVEIDILYELGCRPSSGRLFHNSAPTVTTPSDDDGCFHRNKIQSRSARDHDGSTNRRQRRRDDDRGETIEPKTGTMHHGC
jgi:hypothetical protein